MTYHSFSIEPDWHPIETAPKDRPIWVATKSIDNKSGEQRRSHRLVYWGTPRSYPNNDPVWILVDGDGESFIQEYAFAKNVWRFEDHGQIRELVSYHGSMITHWAYPHEYQVFIQQPRETVFDDIVMTKLRDDTK